MNIIEARAVGTSADLTVQSCAMRRSNVTSRNSGQTASILAYAAPQPSSATNAARLFKALMPASAIALPLNVRPYFRIVASNFGIDRLSAMAFDKSLS